MVVKAPSSYSKNFLSINLIDLFFLIISPFFALIIRWPDFIFSEKLYLFSPVFTYVIVTISVSIFIFLLLKIDNYLPSVFSARDLALLILAIVTSNVISILVSFLIFRFEGIPRIVPLMNGLILLVCLTSYRIILRSLEELKVNSLYDNRIDYIENKFKRVFLVGLDRFSISTIRLVEAQKPRAIQIVGLYSDSANNSGKNISGVNIVTNILSWKAIVDEFSVHGISISEIWISDQFDDNYGSIKEIIKSDLLGRGIVVSYISEALNLSNKNMHSIENISIKSFTKTVQPNYKYLPCKRILDLFVSILLILIISPLYIVLSIIVLIDLGFPILFWQERAGKNGKGFLIYKLRTLNTPIDFNGNKKNDLQRASKVGKFIRRYRLDELPQLLSVVVGDMSLVGPRPLLTRDHPSDLRMRLLVSPGMTGWGQVNGNELLSAEERNVLDLWYISNMSLKIDLMILIKTIYVLLSGIKRDEAVLEAALSWKKSLEEPS